MGQLCLGIIEPTTMYESMLGQMVATSTIEPSEKTMIEISTYMYEIL